MLDVLVIGGGNAALCAALTAREAGASVMLLESAPKPWRGGNSPHTRNIRCMHDGPQDVLVDSLSGRGVLAGPAQGHRRAGPTRRWRASRSAHRRPAATGCVATASTSRRRSPARCTSRGPTPSSWAAARRSSTPTTAAPRRSASSIRYDAQVDATRARRRPLRRGRGCGAERIEARACVLAAGGFESNREWLRRGLGNERARRAPGRQLPHSRHAASTPASCCKFMLDAGADRIGDPTQAHMVAIDARAPLYDGGICTRIDCVSLGVVVNREGEALLRRRRGLLAEALCDLGPARRGSSRARSRTRSSMRRRSAASCRRCFHGTRADSLPELARALGLAGGAFLATLARYNAACRAGTFDHTVLDDCATEGLDRRQDALGAADRHAAVLRAMPLRPGITFTYLGLKVNERAAGPTSAARRATTCSRPAR